MQLDFNKMFAPSKYHASIWTMEVTTASKPQVFVSSQAKVLYIPLILTMILVPVHSLQ